MAVAEWGVQTHVGKLAPPHMFLLGCNRGEDDAGGRQAHVLGILLNVGLPHSRKTQQPEHTVGHTLQDLTGTEKKGCYENLLFIKLLKYYFIYYLKRCSGLNFFQSCMSFYPYNHVYQ